MNNQPKMGFEFDKLKSKDKRDLARLASVESREVVETREVSNGLTLVKTKVVSEIFQHEGDNHFPSGLTFDVRAIKNAIVKRSLKHEVIKMDITPEFYQHVVEKGGIEEPRIGKLTKYDLKRITVGVFFPYDNSLLLIDGNHRVVGRYRRKMYDVRVVMVQLTDCKDYIYVPKK